MINPYEVKNENLVLPKNCCALKNNKKLVAVVFDKETAKNLSQFPVLYEKSLALWVSMRGDNQALINECYNELREVLEKIKL